MSPSRYRRQAYIASAPRLIPLDGFPLATESSATPLEHLQISLGISIRLLLNKDITIQEQLEKTTRA